MKAVQSRLSDILLTALAPISWGTTYAVATEFLPPDHPLLVAALRSLPIGLFLTIGFRKLPQGVWWWRMLVLGGLNIGLFQALLFVAAYRLPGGVAATAGAIQPLLVVLSSWPLLAEKPSRPSVLAAIAGFVVFGIAATVFLSLHTGQTLRVLPKPQHRGRDLGVFNLTNTVPSLVMPWLTQPLVPSFGFSALLGCFAVVVALGAGVVVSVAKPVSRA